MKVYAKIPHYINGQITLVIIAVDCSSKKDMNRPFKCKVPDVHVNFEGIMKGIAQHLGRPVDQLHFSRMVTGKEVVAIRTCAEQGIIDGESIKVDTKSS